VAGTPPPTAAATPRAGRGCSACPTAREPDFAATDWRRSALRDVAADLLGAAAAFGASVLRAAFASGAPPDTGAALAAVAQGAGLPPAHVADPVARGTAAGVHERNIRDVLAAGGFGVPTFVADDGEVLRGQDRVPLLVHHLPGRCSPSRDRRVSSPCCRGAAGGAPSLRGHWSPSFDRGRDPAVARLPPSVAHRARTRRGR
jgi:DSBA-like thioredoxin domain